MSRHKNLVIKYRDDSVFCMVALHRGGLYADVYDILCNDTKWMQFLSLIYFVNQPLHVTGVFIARHQEVFTVYVQQLVCVICLGDWQLVGSGWNWAKTCRGCLMKYIKDK
jgi:hypothetical protein